jgi:subtilisin family serine protease
MFRTTSHRAKRVPSTSLTTSMPPRLRLPLAFAFICALALGLGNLAVTAQYDDTTGKQDAFALKADKILKQVRRAVEADRAEQRLGRFRSETSQVRGLSDVAGVERQPDNSVKVDVAVSLAGESADELNAAGFAVQSRVGDIATLELDVDRLPELASLSTVRKIFASVYRHPVNDRARREVGIENISGQRVVSQTGRGVVVGIIDSGIDFRHLDFTMPGSGGRQTRIEALLDMTVYGSQTPDPNWNYSIPNQTAFIGHLYTEADINAALQISKPTDQNSDLVKQRDKDGHGTHVAGTAAGNGQSSPTPGTYAGMAPEADLIIVKASRQNDGSASFRTTDIINAMQFIQQKAAELNEPFVINMSLGGQLGPHDGTNPDERAIDNLVNSGSGRAVCVAAGNDGDSSIHSSGTVPAAGNLTLDVNAVEGPQFIDLYQASSDRFSVTVTRPDGTSLGPVSYDANGFSSSNGQASDQYLQIFNANDNKGDSDAANDQPDIFLVFKNGAPTGTWRITLQDLDSNANQPFDAWAVGASVSFTTNADNVHHLIASPGTARGAITVGAFVTRSSSLVYGSPAPFTSPGPTADGRLKPEISAPGYYLYSARSADVSATNFGTIGTSTLAPTDSAHYTGLAGTSMATPVTAGSVALLMQLNPSLSNAQIKDAIKNTASPGFSPNWDRLYGNGKLNIAAAVQVGGGQTYTITGHVTHPSSSRPTMYLSGSLSAIASLDSSGNYQFKNLVAGGNYTVTPYIGNTDIYQYSFSPPSRVFSNLNQNEAADFTVTRVEYAVNGFIKDASGVGIPGVKVYSQLLVPDAPFVMTDANGYYSFASLPAGQNYDINPFKTDYTFSPARQGIPKLSQNETINFVATFEPRYKITGRVIDVRGNPVSGITVSAYGPDFRSSSTDSGGNYILGSLLGGDYRISASHYAYVFEPAERAVNLSGNQTMDFTAIRKYWIQGRLLDSNGVGVGGVTVTLSGARSAVMTSNGTGNYSFSDLPEVGTYTITPSGPGYVSTPTTLTFNTLTANITNGNFVITRVNPIDDARTFVTQHYRDFLNREPDEGGLDYWTGEITKCLDLACIRDRRIGVSGSFFVEQEFQQTGYVVYRFYRAAYGTLPGAPNRANLSYANFKADRPLVKAGTALPQSTIDFATVFVERSKFLQAYPTTMTETEFVNTLFDNAGLTGPAYASLRQSKTDALTTHVKSRAQILLDLIDVPEFKTREYNPAWVLMEYFGYLRRDAEQDGYDFWLNVLNNREPNNYRGMVCSFLTSAEYQYRFGAMATRTNAECGK